MSKSSIAFFEYCSKCRHHKIKHADYMEINGEKYTHHTCGNVIDYLHLWDGTITRTNPHETFSFKEEFEETLCPLYLEFVMDAKNQIEKE